MDRLCLAYEQSPTTGKTVYTWDAADKLVARYHADNTVVHLNRDDAGRITEIKSGELTGSFTWNTKNQLTAIKHPTYTETFSYDDRSNLIAHVWVFPTQSYRLSYRYNDKNQLVAKTLPDGNELSYEYTDKNKLTGINLTRYGLLSQPLVTDINNVFDQIGYKQVVLGNGVTQTQDIADDGIVNWAGNKSVAYSQGQRVGEKGYRVTYENALTLGSTASAGSLMAKSRALIKQYDEHEKQPDDTEGDVLDTLNQYVYDAIGQLVGDANYQYGYNSLAQLTDVKTADGTDSNL